MNKVYVSALVFAGMNFLVWVALSIYVSRGEPIGIRSTNDEMEYMESGIKGIVDHLDSFYSESEREKILFYSQDELPALDWVQMREFEKYNYLAIAEGLRERWDLDTRSALPRWFYIRGIVDEYSITRLLVLDYLNALRGEQVSRHLGLRLVVNLILSFILTIAYLVVVRVWRGQRCSP